MTVWLQPILLFGQELEKGATLPPMVLGLCESDTDCGDNQICTSLFHRSGQDKKKACYHKCEDVHAACQTSSAQVGQCVKWAHAGTICVGRADQHQACGDLTNTLCEKDLLCLEHQGMLQGVCSRTCDPEAHATCQQSDLYGTPFCGCQHDEVCSVSPLAISVKGGKAKDGVCTQVRPPGAVCGSFDDDATFQICSEGQVCAFVKDRSEAQCWSELSLMDEAGRPLTKLNLEDGTPFSVGQKVKPETGLIKDFDRQCGCSDSLKPCSNIANILGFVWFGGCCMPESCTP